MHPRVEAYIKEKESLRRAAYEKEKQRFLVNEMFFDFIPNPDATGYSEESPNYRFDPETGKGMYGKNVPIDITDEEYELMRTTASKDVSSANNAIATALRIIACIAYVVCTIASFPFFDSSYGFTVGLTLLISGLISGTVFLGFAEIISLLHKINNKLR